MHNKFNSMKKISSSIVILFAVAIMVFSVYGIAQTKPKTNLVNKNNSKGIIVLELFTSQGCSSCPPADVVLSKYAKLDNPNIIPLAFHVDYWNYIGWKDPFSKSEYSERQREYAKYFNSDGVYTPQLVVNGKYEIVGSKEKQIADLVAKETNSENVATVAINSATLLGNEILIKYSTLENSKNSKINFALVRKKEFTKIKRGENSGLEQTSYNIVYGFIIVGESHKSKIKA